MLATVPAALGEWRKLKRHAARKTARNKGLKEHKTKTDIIPVEVSPPPSKLAALPYGPVAVGLAADRVIRGLWDRPTAFASIWKASGPGCDTG